VRLASLTLLLMSACATTIPTPVEQALAGHEEALQGMGIREIEAGVALFCSPPEAEVLVDGVLQGSCRDIDGQLLRLGEGSHRVQVAKPGMRPYEARVATGKARTVLRVQLEATN